MLEAVVVVGVLLALAVGGFLAYGPITENAKKAKVKSASSEIYTAVVVSSSDGDPNTNPQDAIDAWNDSTNKIRVEILPPTAGGTRENGDFCVEATNLESLSISARTGSCDDVTSGPYPDSGSDNSVTFSKITGGPSISPQGIRYVNAILANAASAATRSLDQDIIDASSESQEQAAARLELTNFEAFIYDSDPYFRTDSGLQPLYSDFNTKQTAFYDNPTIANQQNMVTAYRELFAIAIANPISDNTLHPSPSYPDMFTEVTIPAGSYNEAVARVALPTSLSSPDWSINTSPMGSSMTTNDVSQGVDGDHTYYDLTVGPRGGTGWQVGSYDIFITVMDNRGVSRSTNFHITVE